MKQIILPALLQVGRFLPLCRLSVWLAYHGKIERLQGLSLLMVKPFGCGVTRIGPPELSFVLCGPLFQ